MTDADGMNYDQTGTTGGHVAMGNDAAAFAARPASTVAGGKWCGDEERLAEVGHSARLVGTVGAQIAADVEWLVDRVRALTAERDTLRVERGYLQALTSSSGTELVSLRSERDALIVERDEWKTRVTG